MFNAVLFKKRDSKKTVIVISLLNKKSQFDSYCVLDDGKRWEHLNIDTVRFLSARVNGSNKITLGEAFVETAVTKDGDTTTAYRAWKLGALEPLLAEVNAKVKA